MSLRFIGIAMTVLAVIAAAYFAVTSYREMAKQNANLQSEVTALKADKEATEKAYKAMTTTLDTNETTRTKIVEHTTEIERQINAQPETTDCQSSPAVALTIKRLRDDEQQSSDRLP